MTGNTVYVLLKGEVDTLNQKIDDAIVGVFTNGGSVAFENLPALSLNKVGWAYQITDDFTTTSDFVEGAGKDYPAGTFVSIANTGTDASPVLKYNAMLGVIIVDTALSTTSKNAVENRVITTDLLTRLQKVSAMPQNPSNNDLVLWNGGNTYALGHVYKYVVASGDSLYAWRVSNPDGLGNNTIVYTKSLTPAETTLYKANGEAYDAETDDPTFEFVSYDSATNKITVEILDVNSQETWEKTAGRISVDDRIPTSGWVDVTGYITTGQKDGTALGTKATAEGEDTESSGAYAHAEGLRSEAKGNHSHAEGFEATALGESAHAEGSMTYAEGDFSHAEGAQSEALGKAAHAENWSYVTGDYSHGEGSSIVYGKYAHGEGTNTLASGDASHAGGIGTKAQRRSQMTMGEYNVADTDGASELVRGKYVIIIGNGTGDNARSNALTLDWDGNLAVSGEVEDGNGEKISDKTDKVTNATSGHLAGLDSNGNLTDSGVSPTEEVTVEGNPVTFDSPFEQDAKSVVVSVKPIQDLHGYDHPWVGGAGKNKFDKDNQNVFTGFIETFTHTFTSSPEGLYKTAYINCIPNTTYTISKVAGKTFRVADSAMVPADGVEYINTDANHTGTSITFTTSANAQYLAVLYWSSANQDVLTPDELAATLQIEIGSSPTSYAPYSNICPISGIDEVEIEVSGKNHAEPILTNDYSDKGISIAVQKDSDKKVIGYSIPTATTNSSVNVTLVRFACKDTDNYILTGCALNGNLNESCRCVFWDETAESDVIHIINTESNTISLIEGHDYIVALLVYSGITINNSVLKPMIRRASVTDQTFEPYNPNSHTTTIPLPQTVYDADVDVTNGDATENDGEVDLGDLNWEYDDTYNFFKVDFSSYNAYKPAQNVAPTFINEAYTPTNTIAGRAAITDKPDKCITYHVPSDSFYLVIKDTAYNNATTFKNAVTGIKLIYELATPTTLSFDPTDVELLEGTNVVGTNGEKVAVKYGRSLWQDIDDLKTDTEGKLNKSDVATIEGNTASKAYSVNDFMLRADGLYKVTAPIASGASITASNTTKTTIGAVLTALLNS